MGDKKTAYQVFPINRSGGWEMRDAGYVGWAGWCANRSHVLMAEVMESFHGGGGSGARGSVRHALVDESKVMRNAAILFAAIGVEAFLNLYGVKRLGEGVYEGNFERRPPDKKVSALLKVCQSVELSQDAEILLVVSRLFDLRNALAHPKTTEAGRSSRSKTKNEFHPDEADRAVKDANRFFELFAAYDKESPALIGLFTSTGLVSAPSKQDGP